MNRILSLIIFLHIGLPLSFAVSRYVSIDRQLYRQLEYQFIMSEELPVFVMNQPHTEHQLFHNNNFSFRHDVKRAPTIKPANGISVLVKPGYELQVESKVSLNPSTLIDGYFKIDNFIGVNRLYASKSLASDSEFHGDKGEWVSAYFYDAYMIYSTSPKYSFFGGRTARNIGIPNEFSLFLSDSPYPFDHFGFSATSDRFQFSWYFGRLNDMLGVDDQGLVIPVGETEKVQRYISFQRLDLKVNKRLQIGLSEAALYGGPNQGFVGAYLNPLNFYYLSQRNQKISMNGSWQVNIFYYVPKKWAWYLDFYIDDFIINNDAGVNDRAVHPDRLAVMSKLALPDLWIDQSLTTLRYVRVWNETYVTYRNYENWVYFDKGLGFPVRSYEGLKLESSYLGSKNWEATLSLEGWRRGDRTLLTTLVDDRESVFPANPVSKGLTVSSDVLYFYNSFDLKAELLYNIVSFERIIDSELSFNLGINYSFSKIAFIGF
jgi:hypothetical protein